MASFLSVLRAQHELQTATYGYDFVHMDPEERIDYIRTQVLALTDELHEALRETGWKPWATSRHINEDAYLKELVDAFHFFMNLLLALGWSPEVMSTEFTRMYFEKRSENIERQEVGYDGLYTTLPVETASAV